MESEKMNICDYKKGIKLIEVLYSEIQYSFYLAVAERSPRVSHSHYCSFSDTFL